jgi:hypothetical protein
MEHAARIDIILSTLNATELGTLDSVVAKFSQVQSELLALQETELAERATAAVAALRNGEIAEFKRLRAFLQSRVGHLR